jgi:hypothetical protein
MGEALVFRTLKELLMREWLCTPVTPALGRLRQEDHEPGLCRDSVYKYK